MSRRSVRSSLRSDGRVELALFAVAIALSAVALALPEQRTDSIAGTLRRTVFAPIAGLDERAESARHTLLLHDSVTLTRDSVTIVALDAARISAENDQLRGLLGLGARLRTGFVAAEVLHGPVAGEEHTLVLSAGAQAGVVKFSPVVATDGIIGYIRSVDAKSSVAIVWPHPDFRVSAMAQNKNATGVISAHLGDGVSRYMLELRGVPYRAPLDSGTLIVSSGIGETFPRGLPIGRVVRQLPTVEGWERNYLVMPAVHPADVGTALILLRATLPADVSSAWMNVDSIARAQRDSVGRIAKDSAVKKDSTVQKQ